MTDTILHLLYLTSSGSGSAIISKSCKIVIGDEVDFWDTSNPLNLQNLKKRTRSYDASMCFLVCSPTEKSGKIWQEFLKGSQGYWHLRCQHCGELTMRSCDIRNLQFESTFREDLNVYTVKRGSERLVCPKCHFEHTEDMKRKMNVEGGYVHQVPEMLDVHPSYQIGALASQLPALSWSEVAQAQLEARKDS